MKPVARCYERVAILLLPLALAGLGASCTSEPKLPEASDLDLQSGATVTVDSVVKGDEIVVTDGSKKARVRLVGLHAFDATSADATLASLGNVSAQLLRARLVGKQVTLELEAAKKDSYGRYLAYVTQDQNDVNRALIAEGVALLYDEYPFRREALYRETEQAARASQAGLWSKPEAVALCDRLERQWSAARTQHRRDAR